MEIDIPKIEEWKEVNKIAKQVHELHTKWRPDIFMNVEEVIEKKEFEELIKNKEIYVIKNKDKIIGYITFSVKEKIHHGMHDRKVLNIDAICINKNDRGNGAGTALLNYVINVGKEKKCTDIYLTVNEENTEAISLYEKLGMRVRNIAYSMKI